MSKFTKVFNIMTLGAWITVFLEAIFQDLNVNELREIAIGSSFLVIVYLIFDLLIDRDKRIRRKALEKNILDFINEEKQGEK